MTQYPIVGMDCAHDAREVEAAVGAVPGVKSARVSMATHVLTVDAPNSATVQREIQKAVASVGFGMLSQEVAGSRRAPSPLQSPGYLRALVIVAVLNLVYGIVELTGGILAESQALTADALDFLGDGLITGLALAATSWQPSRRARAALLQGMFLGLLGIVVLLQAMYRVLSGHDPEAGVMGLLGLVALVVNVASVMVIMPYRAGDANVRAVWLFSRNDALGNIAVIAAAGLVALSGSRWPDLVVAGIVAGLFLHSAIRIVADAREELGSAKA